MTISLRPLPLPAWNQARASSAEGLALNFWPRVTSSQALAPPRRPLMSDTLATRPGASRRGKVRWSVRRPSPTWGNGEPILIGGVFVERAAARGDGDRVGGTGSRPGKRFGHDHAVPGSLASCRISRRRARGSRKAGADIRQRRSIPSGSVLSKRRGRVDPCPAGPGRWRQTADQGRSRRCR